MSPQSQAIVTTLLAGTPIRTGDLSIGPLDSDSQLVLRVLVNHFDDLSKAAGAERARIFISLLETESAKTPQDENDKNQQLQPTESISTSTAPQQWRLVEVRATSFRGLAPDGQEISFEFAGKSTLLFGPNGSGKSSLLGAVIWAFTAQAVTDSDEPAETADYFALPQDGQRGKKLGQWLTHVTLPESRPASYSAASSVTIRLVSGDGSRHKWLRRADPDTLEHSDDGKQWHKCSDVLEIGVTPLDLQLSLVAPAIFGRRTIENANESRDILSLMLGYDDLESIGKLASDVGRNRTALETSTNQTYQAGFDALVASIKELPNELDASHPIRPLLDQFAKDSEKVNKETVSALEKALTEYITSREQDIATALGLDTLAQRPTGIGDTLIKAVGVLEGGMSSIMLQFSALDPNSIVPRKPDYTVQESLVRLTTDFDAFLVSATATISARYEWWKQETAQNSRARLLLLAAQHYDSQDEQLGFPRIPGHYPKLSLAFSN